MGLSEHYDAIFDWSETEEMISDSIKLSSPSKSYK